MSWRSKLSAHSPAEMREVAAILVGGVLLVLAAVVLSTPATPSSLATTQGVSLGQADYNGGYPSPISCNQGQSLCYPNTRVGTLSIRRATLPVNSGYTRNVYANNTQDGGIGTPVVLPNPNAQQLVVEWACQPYQTYYVWSNTPDPGTQCNCDWWGGCSPCWSWKWVPYNINFSDASLIGQGIQTNSSNLGSATVTFPADQTSYNYRLQCRYNQGTAYTVDNTVTVNQTHTADIASNPSTIDWGTYTTVTWSSTRPAAQCSVTPSLTSAIRVYLATTGVGSWTVPANWNSVNNTIEVIGGGGGGSKANPSVTAASGGGGGGGYSKTTGVVLTPGASVTYAVGAGGAGATSNGGTGGTGGDTYFCSSNTNCSNIDGTAVVVGAKGGTGGSTSASGKGGGQSGNTGGVGSTKYFGGNGGFAGPGLYVGAGGGGAAGPNGAGASGAASQAAQPSGGSGGGGASGGSAGGNPSGNNGGNGGNNSTGSGGGAGGGNNANGVVGLAGAGGGGGGKNGATVGGAGGAGTEWDSTHGAGGGGGGGGSNLTNGGNAGIGGGYGGGGGGGAYGTSATGSGGSGANGLIVITYVN